jgi:DNA-binding LytR/AlgR family response regulator
MKIKDFFKQPFPVNDHAWKNILFISIFIPVFLFLFQPFGLSSYEGKNKILFIIGYGAVTFIIAILIQVFLPLLFKNTFAEKNWNIGKNIINMLFTIFMIGLGNYFYTGLVFYLSFNLFGILIFQLITLMVATIPVGFVNALRYNTLMAKNLKLAKEMNQQLSKQKPVNDNQIVKITAENEKDFIEINAHDFLFIESNGNYLEINYLEAEKLKTATMRGTLKRAASSLSASPCIVKCHRAFYVNINKIIQVKGNSQGYRLCIENSEKEIPVSRNYSKTIKELLGSTQK